jgi:hypothetical protein
VRTAPLLLAVVLGGCRGAPEAPPAPPPFKPVADVKQLMQAVVDPAADVVWGAVATIDSKDGVQEIFPRNEAEWLVVRNGAITLAEGGNLLMMDGRAKDRGAWLKHSRDLIDVATKALRAAERKDKDAVFDVGGEIYAVCSACHEAYQVKVVEP